MSSLSLKSLAQQVAEKIENDADMMKRNINVLKRRLKNIIESQLEIIEDIDKLDI